jgi:hypothetical protein
MYHLYAEPAAGVFRRVFRDFILDDDSMQFTINYNFSKDAHEADTGHFFKFLLHRFGCLHVSHVEKPSETFVHFEAQIGDIEEKDRYLYSVLAPVKRIISIMIRFLGETISNPQLNNDYQLMVACEVQIVSLQQLSLWSSCAPDKRRFCVRQAMKLICEVGQRYHWILERECSILLNFLLYNFVNVQELYIDKDNRPVAMPPTDTSGNDTEEQMLEKNKAISLENSVAVSEFFKRLTETMQNNKNNRLARLGHGQGTRGPQPQDYFVFDHLDTIVLYWIVGRDWKEMIAGRSILA